MGTINQGILGGFRGKVGNVVGFFWKGQAVMRSLAGSVANPRTPAQRAFRSRFALAGSFTRLFTNIVNATISLPTSYSSTAKRSSRINVMMKRVLPAVQSNSMDDYQPIGYNVDYSRVILQEAEGDYYLINPADIAVAFDSSTRALNVTWRDNSSADQTIASTDIVSIVVVPTQRDANGLFTFSRAVMNDGDYERRDQAGSVTLPDWEGATEAQVYILTHNTSNTAFARSTYAGQISLV